MIEQASEILGIVDNGVYNTASQDEGQSNRSSAGVIQW